MIDDLQMKATFHIYLILKTIKLRKTLHQYLLKMFNFKQQQVLLMTFLVILKSLKQSLKTFDWMMMLLKEVKII